MSDHVLEEQRRYYAERAPEYDDWWFKRGMYELDADAEARWWRDVAEVEAVLRALGSLGEVVELAAGTGIWTRKLVGSADRVVAVDVNAETCFFSYWLSHVPERRFDRFWALVRGLLRPGGRVFLVDTPPGLHEHEGEIELRQLADGRQFEIVKRCWSPDELTARVTRLGFSLELRVTPGGNILYGGGE